MEESEFKFPEGKKSSRHHYIPQFLLNAFVNSDDNLYVFDKQKDKILDNPRPPKSIFFERDRNTVEITETMESSIIEDLFYSKIDSESSKVVKYFQQENLEKVSFNIENTAQFEFFLINLFWRIPKTDFAVEDLMDRSEIKSKGIDPEILRNDPTYRKLKRTGLFKHHIDEMVKNGKNVRKSVNVHQSNGASYVIGDYPLLFRKTPRLFSEFGEVDFQIAISSKRLYSSTIESLKTTVENSYMYNAAIIEQSTRYIACADKSDLQKNIEFYNELKSRGLNYSASEMAFHSKT
ncbi:MAG: DUF4238 domain-containing protein [Vicingaceae bacterium]|nr:DUF4238 domain-containing protein [Vicingaceae bacterium]